jgi:ABC-type branched-subunit amino acid transport system substrate-binding protein
MKHWQGALALAFSMGMGMGLAHAGDAGVTPTEIRLGTSAVLSGPLGPQTRQYGEGARLLFDSINAKGGIHGRKITVTAMDDAFDVARAVQNTKKLVEQDKVFLLFNNSGTAHTAAVLPYLHEKQTITFGPVTGALRTKYDRMLFHVRAGYALEAEKILSQLREIGVTRVAAFYQDDAFGKALLTEIRHASDKENLPLMAEIPLDPAKPDFATAAASTARLNPQAVIIGSAGTTFTDYVAAMYNTPSRPIFYGFSVASLDVINHALKDKARGIVLAQIMPSLRNPTIPVVREYLQLLKAKDPNAKPSASQFEGFVHAKVLVEGLQRTGRDLTTDSFIRTMESAGEIAFGRFTANYTPQSHNGSSYVELAIIDNNGNLRY